MVTVTDLLAPAMAGRGPLPNEAIYALVRAMAKTKHLKLSPHWHATIRNTLQRHCAQSPKFNGRRPAQFICCSKGVWKCL